MTNRIFLLAMLALLASCSTSYVLNPVIDKDAPDPTIIRVGKTYYAAATSGNNAQCYARYKSTDLQTWTPMGYIFDKWPDWTMGAFWAPELVEVGDKVLCYYTARQKSDETSCIGVAVADGPEGKFVDHGPIVKTTNEAIDSYVFNDNGQLWITWKAYGLESDKRPIEILAQKLSADGLTLQGEPVTLITDTERIGCEGQCIIKEGDYYYLLYSIRDCCSPQSDYAVSVARSKSFTGPYEKYAGNPILEGNAKDIQSCGHGTLVKKAKGEYYYLCHAYYMGKYKEGRKGILQKMKMGKDLWPYFVGGPKASAQLKK